MRKLDADRGALALHEGDQRLEAFGLRLVPDAEVVLVDQADFLDAGRLDKDEAEAAERVAAEMHDMEGAAGVACLGAVMHHRRDDEAVLQRQPADGEGLKKSRLRSLADTGSVIHWRISPSTSSGSVASVIAKMPRKREGINLAARNARSTLSRHKPKKSPHA